jgi:hypothetical protein
MVKIPCFLSADEVFKESRSHWVINGIPLITADEGLCNTVEKDLSWVTWLGEVRVIL